MSPFLLLYTYNFRNDFFMSSLYTCVIAILKTKNAFNLREKGIIEPKRRREDGMC